MLSWQKDPRISTEFLEEERRTLGEWWYRQEYLCEFVDTVTQVFASDLIAQAVSHDLQPLFPDLLNTSPTRSDPPVRIFFGG